MSNFLKLTQRLINTQSIIMVNSYKGQYQIKINSETSGMKGWLLYGSGVLTSNKTTINICEKENPTDYKIVTEWIQQQ